MEDFEVLKSLISFKATRTAKREVKEDIYDILKRFDPEKTMEDRVREVLEYCKS